MTFPRYVTRDALNAVSYAAQFVLDCDQDAIPEAIDAIDRVTLKLARMRDCLVEMQREQTTTADQRSLSAAH